MNKVEIWRTDMKKGRSLGRTLYWEEDWYRISRPRMEKKIVPQLDAAGNPVTKLDPQGVEGVVFNEVTVPVLDEDGNQVYDVLHEGLVNDSFIQHNSDAYKTFIEENGEREDARYKTNN